MATNFAKPSTAKAIPAKEAKSQVLTLISNGLSVREAMGAVGRKEATYFDWLKTDGSFKDQVELVRHAQKDTKKTGKPELPSFDVFCREYLRQPLFPHQLRMWDVIEGREPRDLHDSMDFELGDPLRVLINVPPDHAKSTTFTVNYVIYLIHKNPGIRIVILSHTKQLAKNFIYEIKQKLTNPIYRDMHLRFAPEGGWKDPELPWSADRIYVRGAVKAGELGGEDSIEKDPTVQALGWGGSIYGTRSDMIVMDDVIDTKNAAEFEKQMVVLEREVESRLPSDDEGGGLLAILGTRVSPNDLYKSLQDVSDHDDNRVWTYFRQPAVLDYGNGDSSTWTTLWPERWSGKALAKRKRGDASWALIYQQLNVSDDMTFQAEAVNASVNSRRFPGLLSSTAWGHRAEGMEGLYVIGGLDPATVGNTAMIVTAFDPVTEKRYVLDGFNKKNCSPLEMREKVKYLTDTYGVKMWVIERNAFQRFLTQDPELNQFLRSRGCRLEEHYTTDNKFDSDFGIATLGPIFNSCGRVNPQAAKGAWIKTPDTALIELPCQRQNAWVADLIQQLVTWEPQGMSQKAKTDLVMALWFTEIGVQKLLKRHTNKITHRNNPFSTQTAKSNQKVISLSAIRRERLEADLVNTG